MTEEEWLTRCGFRRLEDRPLYARATARQVVLLAAAWLRRFDRYWAPLPAPSEITAAIFHNRQMAQAIDFLERWADGRAGPLEPGEAATDARESAQLARALLEDLVEENEERLMEWRAYVTDSAADAVEFVCDLIRVCRDPGRTLADALTVLGSRSNPNLPPIVLEREGPRRGLRLGTPQQRYLDCLTNDMCGLSGAVAEAHGITSEQYNAVIAAEGQAEQSLMHDIFGNPFRPVSFSPAWRTDTTVSLARQMYESHDFGITPILADALQDAGCDSPAILDHCRGPGPHVRGCWVVDLVLGLEQRPG